jgi:hypothetical protein
MGIFKRLELHTNSSIKILLLKKLERKKCLITYFYLKLMEHISDIYRLL